MKLDLLQGSLQIAMVFSAVKFRYKLIQMAFIYCCALDLLACMAMQFALHQKPIITSTFLMTA